MLTDYQWAPRALGSTWRTVPVARGTSLLGVIAGPIRIMLTHYIDHRSQPCRHACTAGAVRCYCQDGATPKRVYGYLPLILKDESTAVVILCATVAQNVRSWPHGTPVEVIAPTLPKTSTKCRQCLSSAIGERLVEKVQKRPAASIDEYLVHVLWHDPELINYFNAKARAASKPVIPPLVKKPRKPADTPPPVTVNETQRLSFLTGIGLDPNAKS
jgi:hypothetical protein